MWLHTLTPRTRTRAWLLLLVAAALLVGGIALWVVNVARFMEAHAAIEAKLNAGPNGPLVTDAEIDQRYVDALQSYSNQDYKRAITEFNDVFQVQKDHKLTLAYVLLSNRALALLQQSDRILLQTAPQTYAAALTLTKDYGDKLQAQFTQNPTLLPDGITSYAGLVDNIKQQNTFATMYAEGDHADLSRPDGLSAAIISWESLYRQNPNYLKDDPLLQLSRRLADTYESKSIYSCRVQGDYTTALSAANRAYAISQSSSLPADRQTVFLNLLSYITQTHC